jgi:hypothetical protein
MTVLAALAFAGSSHAANGTVTISWDGCSPVVQDKTTIPPNTPGTYAIYLSETGNDTFHTGHQVRVIYANASATRPMDFGSDGLRHLGVRHHRSPGSGLVSKVSVVLADRRRGGSQTNFTDATIRTRRPCASSRFRCLRDRGCGHALPRQRCLHRRGRDGPGDGVTTAAA